MADEKDIEGEEEGGGGKKKLLIIIIAVVVLLIGGGVAAWFLLAGGDEQAEEVVLEEVEPIYHKLDPVFVITLPPGGPAKMLQVAIQVYTRHAEVADFLGTNDPMIRHHLINLLEAQDAATLLTLEGKQALQQALHELIAEKMSEMKAKGEIKGIYFTQFVLQ